MNEYQKEREQDNRTMIAAFVIPAVIQETPGCSAENAAQRAVELADALIKRVKDTTTTP